jgi:hypothetical protein
MILFDMNLYMILIDINLYICIYINIIYIKDNLPKVFHEVIQFNPGKLQKGGGSGLGLYSMYY